MSSSTVFRLYSQQQLRCERRPPATKVLGAVSRLDGTGAPFTLDLPTEKAPFALDLPGERAPFELDLGLGTAPAPNEDARHHTATAAGHIHAPAPPPLHGFPAPPAVNAPATMRPPPFQERPSWLVEAPVGPAEGLGDDATLEEAKSDTRSASPQGRWGRGDPDGDQHEARAWATAQASAVLGEVTDPPPDSEVPALEKAMSDGNLWAARAAPAPNEAALNEAALNEAALNEAARLKTKLDKAHNRLRKLAKNRNWAAALELLEDLEAQSGLPACAEAGPRGARAPKPGPEPTVVTVTLAMLACAKGKQFREVVALFDSLGGLDDSQGGGHGGANNKDGRRRFPGVEADAKCFEAGVRAHAALGQADRALDLVLAMEARGLACSERALAEVLACLEPQRGAGKRGNRGRPGVSGQPRVVAGKNGPTTERLLEVAKARGCEERVLATAAAEAAARRS